MRLRQLPRADLQEPVAWVRERPRAAEELALDLLGFDTQNPPGHTGDVVDWIEARAESWGIDSRRIVSDPDKPNVVLTIPGTGDRTILFNGHLDTVPHHRGRWTYDPLGERVGDRIYGRGAEDMKGPIASLLLAARAVAETDTTPPETLEFAFVADEETDARHGTETLLARGVDPDACVVCETTSVVDLPSVTVAERGRVWVTLEAAGRAAHGSRPMFGVNAIDRLVDAIDDCRRTLEAYRHPIDPGLEDVLEESVRFYAPAVGEVTARRMFERPTVNLGTIAGGEAANSVPDRAVAELDVRIFPGVATGDVLSVVRETLAGHEGVAIQRVDPAAGTHEAPDSPVVGPAVEAARRITGDRVYRRCASGGSDARLFRNAGVPAVEVGLGVGTAHTTDEYTTTDTLVGNAGIYALLPYLYG